MTYKSPQKKKNSLSLAKSLEFNTFDQQTEKCKKKQPKNETLLLILTDAKTLQSLAPESDTSSSPTNI